MKTNIRIKSNINISVYINMFKRSCVYLANKASKANQPRVRSEDGWMVG